jgi:hypothetical protein
MTDISNPVQALGVTTPDQTVQQLYGYLAWALNIPEVGDLLRNAAAQGWSQDRLKAALEGTDWWKTTSDSARTWQQKVAEDNASAQQEITNKASTIRDQLIQQGVTLDDNRIRQVAEMSLQYNWNDAETKVALDSELRRSPGLLQSKVGTQYKALADEYFTNLADPVISRWAADSIAGVSSDEQYREYLVQNAKLAFAGNAMLQKKLTDGMTVAQFYDGYKQQAAKTLGIDPNTINFTDPKWSVAINAKQADGTLAPMTYDQWDYYLKTSPQFNYWDTTQGKQDQADAAQQIGKMFGKTA